MDLPYIFGQEPYTFVRLALHGMAEGSMTSNLLR